MGVGRCRHAHGGCPRAGACEFKQGGDHGSGVTVASSKGGLHPGCQPHRQGLGAARERIGPWHCMNRGVDRIEAQGKGLRYPPKAGREGPFAGRPHCASQHGHAWAIRSGGLACTHMLLPLRRSVAVSLVKDHSHVPGRSAWSIALGALRTSRCRSAYPLSAGAAGRPWRTWMVLGTPWPGPPSKLRKPDTGDCYPGIPHQVACSDGRIIP